MVKTWSLSVLLCESTCDVHFVLNTLVAAPTRCMPSLTFHYIRDSLYPNFITRGPVTPVGSTVTDALLLSCDACTSSLSLSSESFDSIINNYFKFSLEESGKTIDMIFIDAKQDGGRKDISKYN